MGTRDWSNLQVSDATRRFIKESGFVRMTPVQAIAIPLLLNHRDVAVEACTGSGKTLSFLIPVVEILLRGDTSPASGRFNVGCITLAPTRELAGQIHEVLSTYLEAVNRQDPELASKIGKILMVGGSDAKAAADSIQRAEVSSQLQVVTATPGRLRAVLELAGTQAINLRPLETLVFDEADRLLQLGFSADIASILAAAPKQRRTGLFSATLTSELQALMKTGMRNPVHVCVRRKQSDEAQGQAQTGEETTPKVAATRHEVPAKLQNFYVTLPAPKKIGMLLRFLNSPEVRKGKTIVFFLTCACVDFFHAVLHAHLSSGAQGDQKKKKRKKLQALKARRRVEKLHGQMTPVARTKSYETFSKSQPSDGGVLLATDLAARGIDVDAVSWIVQFDAPVDPNAFVHRIGRTARAGHSGKSVIMMLPHEDGYIPFLEKRGIPLQEMNQIPGVESKPEEETSYDVDIHKRTKQMLETDRGVMLKASKGFVSFIRAYQEHQLTYLFPFKSLDLGALATGFCLLRLPKMKEFRGRKIKNFVASSVDPADVPFKDKNQEKIRLNKLKEQQKEWDKAAEDAGGQRHQAAEAKDAKQQAEKEKRTRTEKRKAGRKERALEWSLLQAEETLAKKMRKGQITANEFSTKLRKVARKLDAPDEASGNDGIESDDEGSDSDGEKVGKITPQDKMMTRHLNGRKRRRKKGGSKR